MPQIKAGDRSSLVQYLRARGVDYAEDTVPAGELKPTQAEYSPDKVAQARKFNGTDRAILVSSDGYIVDGHHQAMAKAEDAQPARVIRLEAPIAELLPLVREFPSASKAPVDTLVDKPAETLVDRSAESPTSTVAAAPAPQDSGAVVGTPGASAAAASTSTEPPTLEAFGGDRAAYLRARVLDDLQTDKYGGRRSAEKLADNQGEPGQPGVLMPREEVDAAIDSLVKEGRIRQRRGAYELAADPLADAQSAQSQPALTPADASPRFIEAGAGQSTEPSIATSDVLAEGAPKDGTGETPAPGKRETPSTDTSPLKAEGPVAAAATTGPEASPEEAPQARWTRSADVERLAVLSKAGWTTNSLSERRTRNMPWERLTTSQKARISAAIAGGPVAAEPGGPAVDPATAAPTTIEGLRTEPAAATWSAGRNGGTDTALTPEGRRQALAAIGAPATGDLARGDRAAVRWEYLKDDERAALRNLFASGWKPGDAQPEAATAAPRTSSRQEGRDLWERTKPNGRADVLRSIGYTDADQVRAFSGADWNTLGERVRANVQGFAAQPTPKMQQSAAETAPRMAQSASAPAVGEMVRFPKATINGPAVQTGRVERMLPDGRLEVRAQEGSIFQVRLDELKPRIEQAAAPVTAAQLDEKRNTLRQLRNTVAAGVDPQGGPLRADRRAGYERSIKELEAELAAAPAPPTAFAPQGAEADPPAAPRDWKKATPDELAAEIDRLSADSDRFNALQRTQPFDSAERSQTIQQMDDADRRVRELTKLLPEDDAQVEQEQEQDDGPYQPPDNWRESQFEARTYAKELGIDRESYAGKELADVVKMVEKAERKQKASNRAAKPEVARPDVDKLLADTRIKGVKVKVKAVVAETGKTATFDEDAGIAIKDTSDRLTLARQLMDCLNT